MRFSLHHTGFFRLRLRIGAALAAAVLVSACGSGDPNLQGELLPEYDPVPHSVDTPAVEMDTANMRMPLQFTDQPVVAPGWQTPPHGADGVFLSAGHEEDILTFRAVDHTGTVLWEAERPLNCTGFTLTTADQHSYAILTDIDASVQTFGHTVATAYDLHTGKQAWGPVEVPGPHHGPGAVFAAPPEEAMGASGPKVVLDPATGDVLLDERDTPEITILGEFHGTVLVVHQAQVQAYNTTQLAQHALAAPPLWTLPVDEYDWEPQSISATSPTPNPQIDEGAGAVLIGTNDADRALINLTDGQLLADQLAAAGQDPTSHTWVTTGPQHLAGYDADGQLLYEEPTDGLELIGIGAAIAYLQNTNGDIEARNVITGAIGRSYDPQDTGQLTVPSVITATGAGILDADGTYYLAPTHNTDESEAPVN